MQITVIIPHRGNALGLWATVSSCVQEAASSDIPIKFVIITNGGEVELAAGECIGFLKKDGLLEHHEHFDEPLTPPAARQRGAALAGGDIFVFLDNHCLVARDFFRRVKHDFEERQVQCLHSVTRFFAGDNVHYHYRLSLDYNFWAKSATLAVDTVRPYKIAIGGHGGFAVSRNVWNAVGGYGPESLFDGYGGEETLFDLKLWQMGFEVHLDPKLIHWHYAGQRGYLRHYTDEYYVNMMSVAHVIGGEKWFNRVSRSFISGGHMRLTPKESMFDLMRKSYWKSKDYAQELAGIRKYDLDFLLREKFRTEQVAT